MARITRDTLASGSWVVLKKLRGSMESTWILYAASSLSVQRLLELTFGGGGVFGMIVEAK